MPKLTEWGKKLPKKEQKWALELAKVGEKLFEVAERLYPGVPWQQWTPSMRDRIWTIAEEEWVDDQAKTDKG